MRNGWFTRYTTLLTVFGSASIHALELSDLSFESGSNSANYSALGKANEVYSISGTLPTDVLSNVYGMLPEGTQVNPSFIASNKYASIDIDDELNGQDFASVSVTFLNEGAGYRNSLGYFVYDTNSPPTTKDDINAHVIVFPNASKSPDGEMQEGDTIDLDVELTAGQTLAFFVIPNGWSYDGSFNNIAYLGPWGTPFYSYSPLNPETTAENRRHNVAFIDSVNQFLVFGFEDLYRPQGDNDFNDLLFTVNVSPFTAVDGYNNDGTTDAKYEVLLQNNNADITTLSIYPSANSYATLAFEDRWPMQGDYDFNDVVWKYQIKETLNGLREVKSFTADYHLKAMGAHFHNGFALHLPGVDKSNVDSITLTRNGQAVDHTVMHDDSGETVLIIEHDIKMRLLVEGVIDNTCNYYRTQAHCTSQPDEALNYHLEVAFISPVPKSTLGDAPYDPFIYAVRDLYHGDFTDTPPGMTWQTHLKTRSGTSIMNSNFYGIYDDDTGNGDYFLTNNNMPWAINITDEWVHPMERVDISHAYLSFADWVSQGGDKFTDWYMTPVAGKVFTD